jgi:ribosomal protein S18 acetylase RimI-like enzyme
MVILRRMNAEEFAACLRETVPAYAAGKVASGQWQGADALALSTEEHEKLLPDGRSTSGNHFFTVLEEAGDPVGMIWFAEKTKFSQPIAYVFNIEIRPEHRRRGHAKHALQALEAEVASLGLHGIALHVFGHNHAARQLYAGLGFEPTNISLFKSVATDA